MERGAATYALTDFVWFKLSDDALILRMNRMVVLPQQQLPDLSQVPRITVHGTRKTCGSLLAALDVHPRVAMQILRHNKIAITMEIYTEIPSAATRARSGRNSG